MRVLVTGGAGFIGSKLCLGLLRPDDDAPIWVKEEISCVVAVDNLWRGSLSNLDAVKDDPRFEFVKCDLAYPLDASAAIAAARPDVVYHLADVVAGIDYVFSNEAFVFRQNLLINSNVLRGCGQAGVKSVIYVGTACSFPAHLQSAEEGIVAIHEDQTYPAAPESSYGWSKLMGEYEAELARKAGAFDVGIIRLHNVYGRGLVDYTDEKNSATLQVLPALCLKAIRAAAKSGSGVLSVYGSGEQYRDFLHVDDVVRALLLCKTNAMNQGVVQIGTGVPTTIKRTANMIRDYVKQHLGAELDLHFDASMPEGDRGRVAVLERARDILGWKARVGIDAGLEDLFLSCLECCRSKQEARPRRSLKPIPQMEPWFDDAERNALSMYMRTGSPWLTEFRKTTQFENMVAEYTGAKHAIAVNNGTVSLTIALWCVGVRQGDEVIVPNFSMVATPNAVLLLGAKVKFVDVDDASLCVSVETLRDAITPRTKAVIHVSLNACGHGIDQISALCKKLRVPLVEDSAQSLGSFYQGKHLGLYGDVGSFSFSAPKIISTGQGGILVTNDDKLASLIRKTKDFGRSRGGTDHHEVIGWNFKLTDMQAVIGCTQMKKLPFRVKRMRQIFDQYYARLSGVPGITMLDRRTLSPDWIPWFIDVYTDDVAELAEHMKKRGISTRKVYPPLHLQPCYNGAYGSRGSFPVTEKWSSRGLWLPSSSKLSNADVDRVCNCVVEFASSRSKL